MINMNFVSFSKYYLIGIFWSIFLTNLYYVYFFWYKYILKNKGKSNNDIVKFIKKNNKIVINSIDNDLEYYKLLKNIYIVIRNKEKFYEKINLYVDNSKDKKRQLSIKYPKYKNIIDEINISDNYKKSKYLLHIIMDKIKSYDIVNHNIIENIIIYFLIIFSQ